MKTELSTDDPNLGQQLKFANNALEAEEHRLYEVMLREFYFVIENKCKDDMDEKSPVIIRNKYRPLRNALSLSGPLFNDTNQLLPEDFPNVHFDLTADGAFDHNSPRNREIVKQEAN